MRPVVFDPGPFGEYGGPANDGFAGTGTNKSFSTAGNWTRVFSNTTVMDVRGGVNYYHNIAISQGDGLTTQHRHRHPRRQHRRVHERPVALHDRRLHRAAARVLAQPAVGSVGDDVELRDDA